jgi:hypothetical protein
MADEAVDQASEQSMMERIEGKFGFQSKEQPEAEQVQADDSVAKESDLAELIWGDEVFRVPAKLKDAFMKNEDYTKKTQELADQRRSVEHVGELAKQQQLDGAFSKAIETEQQEISVIDAYLQQVQKLDWSSLSAEQMFRNKMEIDNVKERRAQLRAAIDEKRGQFNEQVTARMKELRSKSRELAAKAIQGFSEQTEVEMRNFAKTEGLTDSEIDNVFLDPRSYKVIYKAMQFDKVKAGTGKAADAATKVDRVLKPGGAGERMPAKTVQQLNFNKAMKGAKTSGEKARVIEDRLSGLFNRGHT